MNIAQDLLFGMLLLAGAAQAQVQPMQGASDPHLQSIEFNPGQIIQLRSAPGYQLMVELSPDEEIQSVALGDSAAWQVSVSKSGSRLFLKPATSGTTTNLTVVTSVRVYNFDLFALDAASADMPYTVQFSYPLSSEANQAAPVGAPSRALQQESRYRISGDRALRPTSVVVNGQRTYIVWPKTSPIPAIYVSDRLGHEALANGMMGTDDIYVVDGAPRLLTFRIDQRVAQAELIKKTRRRR